MKRILILVLLAAGAFQAPAQVSRTEAFHRTYTLKEVVVLSRHNIRAPLSGNGSVLERITPHEWIQWTAPASHLTRKGGMLETTMGQYFREWLDAEGLPADGRFAPGEVLVYANSMQRTLATARYFTAGFAPAEDIAVQHRFAPSRMDPVFHPRLTSDSPAFRDAAMQQIEAPGGKKGLEGVVLSLRPSLKQIEDVLDLRDSPAAKGDTVRFLYDDTVITLPLYEEPRMTGSLKMANSASDALILQYYEEPDDRKAAFGHTLTREDWEKIALVKDVYGDLLFSAPAVAVNVAHPLLQYLRDELVCPERKFSFLCGHDSNLSSVTAALRVTPYELPETIERKTPIGCKLVMEKWERTDGTQFVSLSMVYQSTDDIRAGQAACREHPPVTFPLSLEGLSCDADGLYAFEDVLSRLDEALQAYRRY